MQETTHALDGWYVTGLCEGEACFHVGFSLRKKRKVGIETRPSFSLSLSQKNLHLLQSVQAYFGCGGIRYSRGDRTYKYEVRSIRDLMRKVIPHFERYPLQGARKEDFERFANICRKVHANLHLNREHLKQIIEMAYEMSDSGVRKHPKRDLLRVLGEEKG